MVYKVTSMNGVLVFYYRCANHSFDLVKVDEDPSIEYWTLEEFLVQEVMDS